MTILQSRESTIRCNFCGAVHRGQKVFVASATGLEHICEDCVFAFVKQIEETRAAQR